MRTKTEALVVGKMPLRETSLLLTLLTDRHGIVKAVAKGSRRPRKRYWPPLELLAHLEVVLYRKTTRDMAILSSAEAVDMHSGMLGDPDRFGYGCFLAEFGRAVAPTEQRCHELLMLLCNGLKTMETAPKDGLETVLWAICLKTLYLLGHGPHLLSCVRCRRDLGPESWFCVAEGGMVCASCHQKHHPDALPVTPPTRELLSSLMTESLSALAHRKGDKAEVKRVGMLLDRFLIYHMGVRAGQRSLRYLGQVSRKRRPS